MNRYIRSLRMFILVCLSLFICKGVTAYASGTDIKEGYLEKLALASGHTLDDFVAIDFEDYDGDGSSELFVMIGSVDEDFATGPIWYVDDDDCMKVFDDITYVRQRGNENFSAIVSASVRKYVTYMTMGSGSVSFLWTVRDGEPVQSSISGLGVVRTGTTEGELVLEIPVFDGAYSEVTDGWYGHTYKPYWFYFDEWTGDFREYGGIEISKDTVIQLSGMDLISAIENKGYEPGAAYYRRNGMLTINYQYRDGDLRNGHIIYSIKDNAFITDWQERVETWTESGDGGWYKASIKPEICVFPSVEEIVYSAHPADGRRMLYGLVLGGISGEDQGSDSDCGVIYGLLTNNKLPHTTVDTANIHTFGYNCDTDPTDEEEIRRMIDLSFGDTDDDDLSVFYYSGHDVESDGIPGICTREDPEQPGLYYYYRWDQVLHYLLNTAHGDVIILLDACFADGLIQHGLSGFSQSDLDRLTVFAACAENEYAFPTRPGLLVKGDYVSCFSYEIGKAAGFYDSKLRADENGDGLITVSELYTDIKDRVPDYTGKDQETGASLKMHCSCWTRNESLVLFGDNFGPYGEDIHDKIQYFNAAFEDGKYVMHDSERGIDIYNANDSTLEKSLKLVTSDGTAYDYDEDVEEFLDREGNILRREGTEPGPFVVRDSEGRIIDTQAYYGVYLSTQNPFVNISRVTSRTAHFTDKKAVTLMSRLSALYDFWKINYHRISFDDVYGNIIGVYNDHKTFGFLQADTTNAGSSGNKQLGIAIYSFGTDNELSDDIIAHEFMHSVERSISNMNYLGETAALKEGISDIFGEVFEDWYDDGRFNNSCDWSDGNDRCLDVPSRTKNPSAYGDIYWTDPSDEDNDFGGAHQNSTLISHAAYLMSIGIDDDDEAESLSTFMIGRLILDTLELVPADCNYYQFRMYCEEAADVLLDNGELTPGQRKCVSNAFSRIGVNRIWASIDLSEYLGMNISFAQEAIPDITVSGEDVFAIDDIVLFDLNPIDGSIILVTLFGESEYSVFGIKAGVSQQEIRNVLTEEGWEKGPDIPSYVTFEKNGYVIGYDSSATGDDTVPALWGILAHDLAVFVDVQNTSGNAGTTRETQSKDELLSLLPGEWYGEDALSPSFVLYSDRTCEIEGEYGLGSWNIVNENTFRLTNFYGETESAQIDWVSDTELHLSAGGYTSVFYKKNNASNQSMEVSGQQSANELQSLLPGSWYAPGSSRPSFTLYDDGTCEIEGEYGLGTWSVVNGNVFKLSNYYSETETATILSISDGELHLGDGGYTAVFYNTPQ